MGWWIRRIDNEEEKSKKEEEKSVFDYFKLGELERAEKIKVLAVFKRAADAFAAMPIPKGIKADSPLYNKATSMTFADFDNQALDMLISYFLKNTFIGYQVAGMLGQAPMMVKCCSIPSRDAVRNGWNIVINGIDSDEEKSEIISRLERFDKKVKIKQSLMDYIYFGRLFGVRHAYYRMKEETPDFYRNRYNPDGVKPNSYCGVVQVDPYWVIPNFALLNMNDPASPYFFEPESWSIQNFEVHKSHMSIYCHVKVPDTLKPLYRFGGISLPQMILERLYNSERTANEVPWLMMSKRLTIWKTPLSKGALQGNTFWERLLKFCKVRDNTAIKLIDKDDEIQQFDTTISGFNEVVEAQKSEVSAISNIPQTKLYGEQAKGNSNGENDTANYHEYVQDLQDNEISPLLHGHYERAILSEITPEFGYKPEDIDIDIVYEPLSVMSAKEVAEMCEIYSRTLLNTGNIGANDQLEARDMLRGIKGSPFEQLEEITDEADAPALPSEVLKPEGAGEARQGALEQAQAEQQQGEGQSK